MSFFNPKLMIPEVEKSDSVPLKSREGTRRGPYHQTLQNQPL